MVGAAGWGRNRKEEKRKAKRKGVKEEGREKKKEIHSQMIT